MNWLLPTQCLACDAELTDTQQCVCSTCESSLPYMPNNCARCGQAFSGKDDHCGACISRPPTFNTCFCAFEYETPINDNICQLKYGQQPQIASSLAKLFLSQAKEHNIEMPEALIAVPMHRKQLQERGFNQSIELAKCISHRLGIPLIKDALVKHKQTPRQASQTLAQRKNNLKGSFKLTKEISQKHVAIIDDVVTTSTTVEEIAKILKKNGVNYIQVWGIARTR